jgi:hypothetical protein
MQTIKPEFDSAIGIAFTRILTLSEQDFVRDILNYIQRSVLHEDMDATIEWLKPDVAFVQLVTHRTQGQDFFDTLERYLEEGSPIRQTNRVGPLGSRAVPALDNPVQIRYVFTDVDCGVSTSDSSVYNITKEYVNRMWTKAEVTPITTPSEVVSAEYHVKTTKRTFTITLDVPEGASEVTVTLKL